MTDKSETVDVLYMIKPIVYWSSTPWDTVQNTYSCLDLRVLELGISGSLDFASLCYELPRAAFMKSLAT